MLSLEKPNIPPTTAVRACLIGKRGEESIVRLINAEKIEFSEKQFVAALVADAVHKLDPDDFSLTGISTSDLYRILYEEGLVTRVDGRSVYNRILATSPNRLCPLCGMNQVTSLDHHLPKTVFPTLCVSAANLIPACGECNLLKGKHYPRSAIEHTLHPYFDNALSETWLDAVVVEDKSTARPPHVEYSVSAPTSWPLTLVKRAEYHLSKFQLRSRYALAMNAMLSEQQRLFVELHQLFGPDGVKRYAAAQSESALEANANSFRGIAFRAMSSSDWFCDGGFEF